MSNRNLTGDFISDHPFVTLFLGGCFFKALSIWDEKGSKQRYEIEQTERRKIAIRAKFMKENPLVVPNFAEQFCQFSFGLSQDELESILEEDLFSRWNYLHKGFMDMPLLIREDTVDQNLRRVVAYWLNSKTYKKLMDKCWANYAWWVDNELIIQGKI